MLNQFPRRAGQQNLSPVTGGTDTGGTVDVQANVSHVDGEGLPRVETHAGTYCRPIRP